MKLFRSTALVSAMTFISRIFGFIRDVVIARAFGASALTDAFFVAFRIPNLLRRLFAEGSFASGFVPVLNEYRERRSREELRRLLDAVAGVLLAVVTLIVGLGMLAAPLVVRLFAWGYADDSDWVALTTNLLRITFPYAVFISLTAMAGGILNTWGRFAIPAVTPVLLNLCLIGAALGLAPLLDQPVAALAWGVLLAGALQLAVQIAPLARLGLLPRPRLVLGDPGVRRIVRLMVPTLISSGVYQINLLVDTLMASLIAAGAISWLYYSDRLLEFPLGVFGIAISTVILPTLSRRHAGEDPAGFDRTLDWGLRVAALISVPAAVGLGMLALPIVSTLFNYGEFGETGVRMTALSLAALAAGLPAHIANKVLTQAFYSRQDTRTPMRIAIVSMVANVFLNIAFVAMLMAEPILPAHVGLAFASTCCAWLQAVLLWRGLRRAGVLHGRTGWGQHLLSVGVSCVAMGGVLVLSVPATATWLEAGVVDRVLHLTLAIGAGGIAYLGVLWATGGVRRETFEAPI
ncbi:MAG: murein biosynthesis integral membrane protein MurJ [Pseudomonadota bacterium]